MASYTYARLGRGDLGFYRLFGEGLGNTLFPWARSMVAARDHGFQEIWPAWRQVFHRGGLRDVWKEISGRYGLKNLRDYDSLFQPTGEQVIGRRKLAALLGGRRVSEEAFRRSASGDAPRDGSLVIFKGLGHYFADLEGCHEFLRAELWKRTAPAIREQITAADLRRVICLHVRMGDFPDHPVEKAIRQQHNSRLPQSWYVEKVRQLRTALGEEWPVYVFSDGRDAELAEVLAVPGARRAPFGSALADIWAMAAASVIVCSLSTMNNWACYLGRPPAIRLRGTLVQRLYTEAPLAEIESGVGEELPPTFVETVRRRESRRDGGPPISNLAAAAGPG